MTTYTFVGNPNMQSVAWNDGTVWSSGDPLNPFPNSPTADVVIPEITKNDGSIYTSFITIQNSASYAANSVSLTDNDLIVNGALSVTNGVDVKGGGEINIGGPGATISAGSLTVESAVSPANGQIQGNGHIQVVTLTNSGTIVGGDLTVDAHVLDNIGTLTAGSGTFTVVVDSGGFSNLSGSTLTGGSYVAPGAQGGCILDLDVGAVITTDAANIQLGGDGDFRSFDNGSSTYVSLQASLTTIAQGGTLGLTNQTFNSNGLTVNGTLTLSYSSANLNFVAPLLTVGNQGTVSGVGTIIAPINNAGIITAGFMPGDVVTIAITPAPQNNLLDITGAVSGTGVLQIGAPYAIPNGRTNTFVPATLQLDGPDSENVVFNNAIHGGGTLLLNDLADFTGAIAPGSNGDNIILPNMSFSSVTGYSYAGNTSGGTLTIHETGNVTISLNFLGDLDTADFTLAAGPQPLSSSPPSLEITVNPTPPPSFPPPNPAVPAGTTAVMVLDNVSNYEIYDIGNNSVLAAYPLATIGTPWHAVGFGGFNGSDTADMMLRSSSNGAFEIVDINNNNGSGPVQLGAVGLVMGVTGFGDFSGRPGETDMLMRDSTNGNFVVYDISNNMVTGATTLGAVGLQEQVLGLGDFSGRANETDMLLRDANSGMVTLYDISNNMVTSATALGAIGTQLQFAGAGDFSGRPGETDMLMRDSSNGNFVVYDIQNGSVTSATSMGAVGLSWKVAGFGDFSGNANETDMMIRTDTGAFMIYDISNNQVTGVHSIGSVGLDWQVAGIAKDPPSSGAPSSGATIASDQVQSSLTAPAAFDPAEAGGWLSQMMQPQQSDPASWLTEVMQAGASPVSGPGFDAGSDLMAGTMPATPLAMPNLLPTHSA